MARPKSRIAQSNFDHYKLAYEAWVSEGSLERARMKLERDGVVNSFGRPYAIDSVRKSAVKYMVANYAETKRVLMENYAKSGYIVNEENIERYIIKMAISSLRLEEKIVEWLKENNLYGKHIKFIDSLIAISYDD